MQSTDNSLGAHGDVIISFRFLELWNAFIWQFGCNLDVGCPCFCIIAFIQVVDSTAPNQLETLLENDRML